MRVYFLAFTLLAQPVLAEAPQVVVDIAPIHSLVARVMAGAGSPDVILPPGASPHGYAMRPSEARRLAAADVVVWVGPGLTPWLADPLDSLAPDALHVDLMQAPGIAHLPFREGEMFQGHDDHDDAPGKHDDHAGEDAHADHDAHDTHDGKDAHDTHDGHEDHADHAAHEDTDQAEAKHDDHDDHDHAGAVDPHIWLDPQNAVAILKTVSEALAQIDPDNAALYQANADAGAEEIATLQADITALLAPVRTRPFVVSHDAYHYFEARFGVEAVGAISLADGSAASAGHLSEVRDTVAAVHARCALTDVTAQKGLLDAVFADADIRVETVDPITVKSDLGTEYYGRLLTQMSEGFARCLTE